MDATDYNIVIVHGADAHADVFTTVGPALMICQLISVLEAIHPLLGWVKTGVMMPLMQVLSFLTNYCCKASLHAAVAMMGMIICRLYVMVDAHCRSEQKGTV